MYFGIVSNNEPCCRHKRKSTVSHIWSGRWSTSNSNCMVSIRCGSQFELKVTYDFLSDQISSNNWKVVTGNLIGEKTILCSPKCLKALQAFDVLNADNKKLSRTECEHSSSDDDLSSLNSFTMDDLSLPLFSSSIVNTADSQSNQTLPSYTETSIDRPFVDVDLATGEWYIEDH